MFFIILPVLALLPFVPPIINSMFPLFESLPVETCNFPNGSVVPIPTLPELLTRNLEAPSYLMVKTLTSRSMVFQVALSAPINKFCVPSVVGLIYEFTLDIKSPYPLIEV